MHHGDKWTSLSEKRSSSANSVAAIGSVWRISIGFHTISIIGNNKKPPIRNDRNLLFYLVTVTISIIYWSIRTSPLFGCSIGILSNRGTLASAHLSPWDLGQGATQRMKAWEWDVQKLRDQNDWTKRISVSHRTAQVLPLFNCAVDQPFKFGLVVRPKASGRRLPST